MTSGNGILKMVKEEDVVRVGNNFLTYGNVNPSVLSAGTLYVAGNFTEKTVQYSGVFKAIDQHTVVFNGNSLQKIYFDRHNENGFANVTFENPKIELASGIRGFSLNEDINLTISASTFAVDGTLYLNGHSVGEKINGNEELVFTGGTIDFGSSRIPIKGNLLQTGGTLYVDGGELSITGDYYLAGSRGIGDDGKEIVTFGSGILKMAKEEDVVRVGGNFLTYGNSNPSVLSAGTLYVAGNFTQKTNYYGNIFNATGSHTVAFNGNSLQKVYFQNYNESGFANVTFENPEIEFASDIRGFSLNEDINLTISASTFEVNGTLDLNAHSVVIKGDLLQTGGTLYINGGELSITGDYYLAGSRGIGDDGKETVTSGSGILKMVKEADIVRVGGSFLSNDSGHSDYERTLSAGTLYVAGDFEARNGYRPTGSHTVVLYGNRLQNVFFQYTGNQFNNVMVKKPAKDMVTFSPNPCWNNYYEEIGNGIPDLLLPAFLLTVDEEAFMGCSFEYAYIQDCTTAIKSKAFANCKNLIFIRIPESVSFISPNAFEETNNLTIIGKAESYAEQYAKDYGFAFIAE